MPQLAPTEIAALARIIEELDYYQLLHLDRSATPREVKAAYHATSRAFHPDANRHLPPPLRAAVESISKRICEAYSVLRDPERRPAYDRHLAAGGAPRLRLAEAEAQAQSQRRELAGRTPRGRQYFALAQSDLRRGDAASAARNLQMALTFEPENAGFQELLGELRQKARS
jgi:DnaJ-class molecular chaperone